MQLFHQEEALKRAKILAETAIECVEKQIEHVHYDDFDKAVIMRDWFAAHTEHPHPERPLDALIMTQERGSNATFYKHVAEQMAYLVAINQLL